jgi:hypothetical protein
MTHPLHLILGLTDMLPNEAMPNRLTGRSTVQAFSLVAQALVTPNVAVTISDHSGLPSEDERLAQMVERLIHSSRLQGLAVLRFGALRVLVYGVLGELALNALYNLGKKS